VIPHAKKRDRTYALPPFGGGEDSYFVAEGAGVVGVADGVGGWARKGVDPGLHSRGFMALAAAAVEAGLRDPAKIVAAAHRQSCNAGSSTVLVVGLDDDEGFGRSRGGGTGGGAAAGTVGNGAGALDETNGEDSTGDTTATATASSAA
jgi:hypothetical protein